MLWLSKPPYLRWVAAAAIVIAALVWDLSGRQTDRYPFADADIARGTELSQARIVWKPASSDLFVVPDFAGTTALADISKGDPITRSVVSRGVSIPDGWWAIPMSAPTDAQPGAMIRAVLPGGVGVLGIVVRAAERDTFGSVAPATVAFPEEIADVVARAEALGDVVVLIEP